MAKNDDARIVHREAKDGNVYLEAEGHIKRSELEDMGFILICPSDKSDEGSMLITPLEPADVITILRGIADGIELKLSN